tara:strand:+ start:3059 stop:3322 length:264 start_codon:yes stop_codon:yes gene_type:complete
MAASYESDTWVDDMLAIAEKMPKPKKPPIAEVGYYVKSRYGSKKAKVMTVTPFYVELEFNPSMELEFSSRSRKKYPAEDFTKNWTVI